MNAVVDTLYSIIVWNCMASLGILRQRLGGGGGTRMEGLDEKGQEEYFRQGDHIRVCFEDHE